MKVPRLMGRAPAGRIDPAAGVGFLAPAPGVTGAPAQAEQERQSDDGGREVASNGERSSHVPSPLPTRPAA